MARPPHRKLKVIEAVRSALRSGRLKPGDRLRTGLVEAAHWGTSHPTLRAALRDLETTGEIEASARGFRVPSPSSRTTSARVLWLSGCGPDGTISGESEREWWLRRHLDLACRRDGLHLRVAGVDSTGRVFLDGFAPTDLPTALKDVFGVVLCPWRMDTEAIDLAKRLSHGARPAAIWGESGLQGTKLSGGRSCIFDNGHMSTPGKSVGIHLRNLGHRCVVYLSAFHGTDWSARRLAGLRSAIEPEGRIVPTTLDGLMHPIIHEDGWIDGRNLSGTPILGPHLAQRMSDLRSAHALLLREDSLFRELEPLFERALLESGATAWVCSNDDQAILALHWLRRRGIEVPGRISLVGFDDSNRGQDLGLTSWSFSEMELAEAMLHHLVHPKLGADAVRIEGSLVVRGSTTKAFERA